MNESQRERLFRALVGPVEGISRGTREVLERICAEEMRRIAPVVDDIIADCFDAYFMRRAEIALQEAGVPDLVALGQEVGTAPNPYQKVQTSADRVPGRISTWLNRRK